jgi:hypothetical protein
MRNPERWRNAAIALFLAGPAIAVAAFALPERSIHDDARGAMFAIGMMCTLFAGVTALVLHQDVKRQRRLARGEGLFARWRIAAADWQAFVALDEERNTRGDRLRNEFSPRAEVSAQGVEIAVGKDAVEIDGNLFSLPLHGAPEITRAEFDESRIRISVIEFDLTYPGDGISDEGTPQGPRRSLLRFPVPVGAQREAQAIVTHFGRLGPQEPTFFHGRGDGSDPEDLATCWKCGFQTHRFASRCERCGATMQTKRWARRAGWLLVVIGLGLSLGMSWLLAMMLPMLLHPGDEINGSRFTGSPGMASFVILILGGVLAFGLLSLGYGVFQVVTGRRSWPVVRAMLAIVGAFYLLAMVIRAGWL